MAASDRQSDAVGAWEIADDPAAVHALLVASDAAQATPDAPAPQRRPAATEESVRRGRVHLLRIDGVPAAQFRLEVTPGEPVARLSRLAVAPRLLGEHPLLGVLALRRAIEVATRHGAHVLRSEANPDLTTYRMLTLLGFEPLGEPGVRDGLRFVRMERALRSEMPA